MKKNTPGERVTNPQRIVNLIHFNWLNLPFGRVVETILLLAPLVASTLWTPTLALSAPGESGGGQVVSRGIRSFGAAVHEVSLSQDRLMALCYAGGHSPSRHASAGTPAGGGDHFAQAWAAENGVILDICRVIFADIPARFRADQKTSERTARPVMPSLLESAVEELEASITGPTNRWPGMGDHKGAHASLPPSFFERYTETDIALLHGPIVGTASGSILDGELVGVGVRAIRVSSSKASALLASYGSCMVAKRNRELASDGGEGGVEIQDIFQYSPPVRSGYVASSKYWRDYLATLGSQLMGIAANVSASPLEAEQLARMLGIYVHGLHVVIADPGKAPQCGASSPVETWRAGLRLSDQLAKTTAYELAGGLRVCDSLHGGKVFDVPSLKGDEIELMGARAGDGGPSNPTSYDPLDSVAGPTSLIGTSIVEEIGQGIPGEFAIRKLISDKFSRWIVGKYGGASIGDNKDQRENEKIKSDFFKESLIRLKDQKSYDLMLSDWTVPYPGCLDLPPVTQSGGGLMGSTDLDIPVICKDPGGTGQNGEGKTALKGLGFYADQASGIYLFSPDLFITEIFSQIKVARQMWAAAALVATTEDIKTGSYRTRRDPSNVCFSSLRDLPAGLIRKKRDSLSISHEAERVAIYLGLEAAMAQREGLYTARHLQEQERLFAYAAKMRQAMAREDTRRAQEKIRSTENRSDRN